jgi:hypothetical protein
MIFSSCNRVYALDGDRINATFYTITERPQDLTFTIESATDLINDLNIQIRLAKEAKLGIIENEIKAANEDISTKQSFIEMKIAELNRVKQSLGIPQE